MRSRKTLSRSDNSRKGIITQRMLYERKREEELFTALAKKGWIFQVDVGKDIYNQYCVRIDFRLAINKYLIQGKTSNHTLQKSFNQLPNHPFITKILIYGEVGSGKSRVARKVVRNITRAFGATPLYQAPSGDEFKLGDGPFKLAPVTFDLDQSRAVIGRDDAPGSVLHQDEMPEMRGENSKRFKQDMTNLMKVSARAEKIHFVFVNPELIVPFKLNWVIEVLGANYEKKTTLCMLYYLTRKTLQPMADGVLIFDVDEPPELTAWYEDMAIKNKINLREHSGTSTAQWTTADQDVQDILGAVEKAGGVGTKGLLEAFVKNPTNMLQHVFDHGFMKNAIDVAWSRLRDSIKTSDEIADIEYDGDLSDFTVDEAKLLADYPNERDAQLYLRYQEPNVIQDDLAAEFKLDQSTVSKIAGKRGEVAGWLADRIGILYELFVVQQLHERFPGAEILRDGSRGEPDIRLDEENRTVFYSVKCYNTTRKKVSVPVAELGPEIKAARELKEEFPDRVVKCILHFYNRATNQVLEREIRFIAPPASFLFKLKK